MSYHGMGTLPSFSPTTLFAEAVDPYSMRFSPPGAIYSPYGWGPDFNIGMPMNYTHHIGYETVPIAGMGALYLKPRPPGTRPIGPMYDEVGPFAYGVGWYDTSDYQQLAGSGDGLSGIYAVL